MDDALPAAATKTSSSPPTTAALPSTETLRAPTPNTADNRHVADMDRPPLPPPMGGMYDNAPTTPKGDVDSRASTFRGPGGSPILERTSPIQHRPYPSSGGSSIGDRRESSSLSPTLTRQDNPNAIRMLPPPSPPTQRHQQGYTGMDLPPLSSLTSGLPHRPPSSGSMSISSMLGGSSSSNDMGMHSMHHHHPPPPPPPPSHHLHNRPPARPYTPEYGNPLAPGATLSSSNPLAPRSQSTPSTPALGYPDTDASGHGRSSSYGRLSSNQGGFSAPFREAPYRVYINREPMPHQRDEFPPRPRDAMNMEQPPSPQPSQQHLQDIAKQNSQYSHQVKHSALSAGIPPPAPHHHQQQPPPQQSQQQHHQQQQHQQQQPQHSQPSRPITNGSSSRSHHHHHHRPPSSQPIARQPPPQQSRPQPKVIVNNTPALDAVANINPKPFLGRFIYEPGWIIPESVTEGNLGGHFEVRIPYRFLSRENEGLVRRKLWGTGVYTDDSDVVAVLYHTSTLPLSPLQKPKDLAAHFLVLPTLQHYAPSTLNELRSRGWKTHDGYSIYLDRVEWIELGSAEGVWRGRKRRLNEELRMEVDGEEAGVVGGDTGELGGFRGVNWEVEPFLTKKRAGEEGRVGVVA